MVVEQIQNTNYKNTITKTKKKVRKLLFFFLVFNQTTHNWSYTRFPNVNEVSISK
jgi:hypothetical protein